MMCLMCLISLLSIVLDGDGKLPSLGIINPYDFLINSIFVIFALGSVIV